MSEKTYFGKMVYEYDDSCFLVCWQHNVFTKLLSIKIYIYKKAWSTNVGDIFL